LRRLQAILAKERFLPGGDELGLNGIV
jgi:hypothetical protein